MKPCTKVGIDCTWKCNWKCDHCFYLRNPNFHKPVDVPFDEVKTKIDTAKANGLNHVVLVGYGEPSLCENTPAILNYSHKLGMTTSMITNGATGLKKFQSYFQQGINHLHISSHGYGDVLDEIVGVPGACDRQYELKSWLQSSGHPFRTNMTLQQKNYKQLPEVAKYEIGLGVYHFVFLGFLPHYEWNRHVDEIAVHPALLQPYIEDAVEELLYHNKLFSIRYHPFCYLQSKYWKYVVNSYYIPYDPFEWNYDLTLDPGRLQNLAIHLNESVANKCQGCKMRIHCGGWNRIYANAFKVELKPILFVPDEYKDKNYIGGLHDMNPTNHETGILCKKK